MQRVNLPDDKPGAGAQRGRPHGGVRQDGCAACGQLVQRLQSSGTEFDLYMVGSRQDDTHPRLGQARERRSGARAQRHHHAQPRRRPLAVAGPARRLARRRARGERPMAAPAVVATSALRALVLAAGLYACAAHAQEVPPPAYQLAAQRARHPLDGALRRGLAGERHPAQRAHRPVAVVAQRRRPVAPLRHARRRLRRPAAGDARHAAHAHRRGPGPDQPRLPPSTALPARATCWTRTQPGHRRRDPEGQQHTPARTGCWRSAATTVPAAENPPPAIGAACRATLPACRASPNRRGLAARQETSHDEIPSAHLRSRACSCCWQACRWPRVPASR